MKYTKTIAILFLTHLFSCSDMNKKHFITFEPQFKNKNWSCDMLLTQDETVWKINQFQFFISNIELQNQRGQWQTPALKVSPYQSEQVALIGELCSERKSANWQIELSSPIKNDEYKNIRFSIGVPFELNHLNPLTQQSPLNLPSMFWVWQTGHKFIRLEMSNGSDNWLYHLGSTGCTAPSAMRAPKLPCLHPNLVEVEMALNNEKKISVDLSSLLSQVSLGERSRCQSEAKNLTCKQLLKNVSNKSSMKVFRQANE